LTDQLFSCKVTQLNSGQKKKTRTTDVSEHYIYSKGQR